ncbi:MAG: hypothetical protein KJO07_11165 [Deltaproteobacteria bacterium]|nr:hypothetical protein [Deltaproteobacteria bacterium]
MRHLAVIVCLTIASTAAWAQEGEKPPASEDKADASKSVKASAAVSLVDFERVMSDAKCDPRAIKDPRFVADAKNAIRPLIHDEDAKAMLTNKKHVVMAYAAILVIMVGFLVMLLLRQNRLAEEIARLQDELEKAMKE